MTPALDEPASLQAGETEPREPQILPATAGAKDPLEVQLDLGLRVTTDMLVESAKAWSALSRTYADVLDVHRRAYGELLIDWHQRFLRPTGR
jgi:hypothetical protein